MFRKGNQRVTWGAEGEFGQKAKAKIEAGHVAMQLAFQSPSDLSEASPYISFSAKVPRDMSTALSYGKDIFHTIEFRFNCGVGSIAYRKIKSTDPEFNEVKAVHMNGSLPEEMICVRFRSSINGPRPYVVGHNWPNKPLNEEGIDVIDTAKLAVQSEEWKLFFPYDGLLEQHLLGSGKMFGEKGYGFRLNQYLTNGRVL